MPTLPELIPDIDVLVAMPPEELGHYILQAVVTQRQNDMFLASQIIGDDPLFGRGFPGEVAYPRQRRLEISMAAHEAWQWLEINLLIMPAMDANGANGWKILTRRGQALAVDANRHRAYAAAVFFPKSMLHPSIADDVWLDLARGDYSMAVFRAFRSVEEAVREAGGFAVTDIGVDLMRRAFNSQNGPLAKQADPVAEREGLAALFAGAIGSYKNPHSHRTVELTDAREAQEMATLASHLLRIVDARRPVA